VYQTDWISTEPCPKQNDENFKQFSGWLHTGLVNAWNLLEPYIKPPMSSFANPTP